jgi:hypothetical protein
MFVRNRTVIADLLSKQRLPAISVWRSFTEAGVSDGLWTEPAGPLPAGRRPRR